MVVLERVDLKKDLKALYGQRTSEPVIVDVPAMNFLMVDGTGDPNNSPIYEAAIQALYGVSYTLRFAQKRSAHPVDYKVMPLEGLWWADDMAAFVKGDKSSWHWTALITQPSFITREQVSEAIAAVRKKRPTESLDQLRFEKFHEGHSAQLLYVGSYADEAASIERLHAFIARQGGTLSGKHHEIYLSDPRRVTPEKLKTIIRQPFTA